MPSAAPTAAPSHFPSPAASHVASPSPAPPSPAAASPSPSPGARPTPSREEGAAVVLDHLELTRVPGAGELTAKERAQILVDRLEVALEHATEPPEVLLDMVKANPVLAAEGVQLITVTERDAVYMDVPKAVAAVQYRTQLERGLDRVWSERNGLLFASAMRRVAIGNG